MVFHFSNFRMALLLQDVSAMKLWSLACYIVRHWVIDYDQPVPLVFMNQLILQYMPLSCSRSVLQATIQVKGWLGVKMYWATPIRSRLDQRYVRFLTIIFSAKHIEVKQSKDVLPRKWEQRDLCALKSFFNFHSENVSMGMMRSDVFWC
jgi:hypothetical protein